ncbi:MAG: hypothetical protein JJU05_15890 [Verrucomicrobia bacterium]|nr:hypothetical protein [Verrucomicrobiota bacterium]MCH8528240.1 hypothetical protein [Kiritimatiellia bacterium]
MRFSPLFPILSALFIFTGCFQREVRIFPEPDGSGTLEILTTLSDAFLRYAEAHAGLPPDRIWFHEQALSHAASQYGGGVRYQEHDIEAQDGSKLFRVRYHFDQLSDLSLDINLNAPFLFRPQTPSAESLPRFRFDHEPGLIKVTPPTLAKPAGASTHVRIESANVRRQRREQFDRERQNLMSRGNAFQIPPRAGPEEILKRLARDMMIRLEIILPGELISSNARFIQEDTHAAETTILLFSFSGDEFIQSREHLKRLAEEGPGAFEWHDLRDFPGVSIETGETILIRF